MRRTLGIFLSPLDQLTRPFRLIVFAILVSAAFAVFVAIGFGYGPIFTSDGRRWHLLALALIELDLNPVPFVAQYGTINHLQIADFSQFEGPTYFYILYFYVLAFIETVSGGHWMTGHVLLNAVAQAGTAGLSMMLAARAFGTVFAVVVSFLMAITCWEFLQWVAQTQSDTLFALVAVAQFYLIYSGWTAGPVRTARRYLIAGAILGLIAIFYRPTGPALAVVGLFSLAAGLDVCRQPMSERFAALRGWFVGAALAAFVVVLLGALVLFDPSLIPSQSIAEKYWEYHDIAALGSTVEKRFDLFLAPSDTLFGFVRLGFARLAFYFWFLTVDFSPAHRALNIAFFVPFYALVVAGLWIAFGRNSRAAPNLRLAAALAVVTIASLDVTHAASLIDFDWRYRVPAYPALFFLAVLGSAPIRLYLIRWFGALGSPHHDS
jgi:hypothetical protein